MAAPRYFLNRINTHDIEPFEKAKKLNTITHLLQNNGYNASAVLGAPNNKKHTETNKEQEKPKQKGTNFIYFGAGTMITHLFRV
jgi:hypothetical protein